MQTGLLPFDVVPSALLPSPFNTLVRPIEPVLRRHFLPDTLCRGYTASDPVGATADMLRHLDIHYKVEPSDVERIPKTGPCLIVANHPFGLLEASFSSLSWKESAPITASSPTPCSPPCPLFTRASSS
jgi:putative hemolysin